MNAMQSMMFDQLAGLLAGRAPDEIAEVVDDLLNRLKARSEADHDAASAGLAQALTLHKPIRGSVDERGELAVKLFTDAINRLHKQGWSVR